jgi:hypothetical protein
MYHGYRYQGIPNLPGIPPFSHHLIVSAYTRKGIYADTFSISEGKEEERQPLNTQENPNEKPKEKRRNCDLQPTPLSLGHFRFLFWITGRLWCGSSSFLG